VSFIGNDGRLLKISMCRTRTARNIGQKPFQTLDSLYSFAILWKKLNSLFSGIF